MDIKVHWAWHSWVLGFRVMRSGDFGKPLGTGVVALSAPDVQVLVAGVLRGVWGLLLTFRTLILVYSL